VGIAGFCLSGRTPLVYAAARDDVTAIVVFHGGIYPRDYDARLPGQETIADVIPRISCPVLGQFGEIDRLVPMENVERFRRELEASGKSYRVHVYANTPHGWLNTTQPEAHRPEQAARAWSAMVTYFGEVFAGTWEGRRRWEFEADPAVAYDFAG
jgi:carboxymethylenebutenolidase